MTLQQKFNEAYRLSKPPEIRAVLDMSTNTAEEQKARAEKARDLAQQGFVVDAHIDAWGMDAYHTMRLRHEYGYTWVPSALQPPVTIAPGLLQPGTVPYDPDHPPAGSIRVSINTADYPPFEAKPQAAQGYQPPNPATYEQLPGIFISPGVVDNWPIGSEIVRDGKTLVKVRVQHDGPGWRSTVYWRLK